MKKNSNFKIRAVDVSSQRKVAKKSPMKLASGGRVMSRGDKTTINASTNKLLEEKVKVAKKIADEMIKIACLYAKKWGRTSSVGFISMYDQTGVDTVLDVEGVKDHLTNQKNKLIETIENGGVAPCGVKKGTPFNLSEDDFEDVVIEIFVKHMIRLGIAIADDENLTILEQVFRKTRDGIFIKSEEKGGISSNVARRARLSFENIKPAYTYGLDGWEKMFKELDQTVSSVELENVDSSEKDDDDSFYEPVNDFGDIRDIDGAEEGSAEYRMHLIRERDRSLIKRKKDCATSLSCEVCGFNFKEQYGDLGKDYCEVHHKIPLSLLKKSTRTELSDLAIVCSNCHRMLHRKRNEILTIEELRNKIKKKKP